MVDTNVEFELAEACLAYAVGNPAVQAYQRSSMLERRSPIMQAWSRFLSDEDAATVVNLLAPIRR